MKDKDSDSDSEAELGPRNLVTSIIDKIRIMYLVSDSQEYSRVQPCYTGSRMSKDPCFAIYCNDGSNTIEKCALYGLVGARVDYTGKSIVTYYPVVRKSLFTEAGVEEFAAIGKERARQKRLSELVAEAE